MIFRFVFSLFTVTFCLVRHIFIPNRYFCRDDMQKPQNWHRADIVAEVHKRGTTLAELARDNDLSDSALRNALSYPRSPSNRIIATFIGRSIHDLWPTWFDEDGNLIDRSRRSGGSPVPSSQKRRKNLSLTERCA